LGPRPAGRVPLVRIQFRQTIQCFGRSHRCAQPAAQTDDKPRAPTLGLHRLTASGPASCPPPESNKSVGGFRASIAVVRELRDVGRERLDVPGHAPESGIHRVEAHIPDQPGGPFIRGRYGRQVVDVSEAARASAGRWPRRASCTPTRGRGTTPCRSRSTSTSGLTTRGVGVRRLGPAHQRNRGFLKPGKATPAAVNGVLKTSFPLVLQECGWRFNAPTQREHLESLRKLFRRRMIS
jgi:hypothetical protein